MVLVPCLRTLHPKPHRSGRHSESAFELLEPSVAVLCVAVADVAGERVVGGVPVDVVGVVEDELLDWQEVALPG